MLVTLLSIGLTRDPAGVVAGYLLPPPPPSTSTQIFPNFDELLKQVFAEQAAAGQLQFVFGSG